MRIPSWARWKTTNWTASWRLLQTVILLAPSRYWVGSCTEALLGIRTEVGDGTSSIWRILQALVLSATS